MMSNYIVNMTPILHDFLTYIVQSRYPTAGANMKVVYTLKFGKISVMLELRYLRLSLWAHAQKHYCHMI